MFGRERFAISTCRKSLVRSQHKPLAARIIVFVCFRNFDRFWRVKDTTGTRTSSFLIPMVHFASQDWLLMEYILSSYFGIK